jgi:hypothetical protein
MSAIEYGSYYWCVVLSGKDAEQLGESIHLHADEMSVDGTGSLIFKSAGRRPAGTEPNQDEAKDKDGERSDAKGKDKSDSKDMIYVAFAAGSWKMVYAAKLQDGSPASVEHWKTPAGQDTLPPVLPTDAGAVGYPAGPPVPANLSVDPAFRR